MQQSYAQSIKRDVFFLYEDSAKTLTGEAAFQLYKEGKFTTVHENDFNKGFTRSIFWLAYKMEARPPADSLLLFIGHHHINRIRFFYVKDCSVQAQ